MQYVRTIGAIEVVEAMSSTESMEEGGAEEMQSEPKKKKDELCACYKDEHLEFVQTLKNELYQREEETKQLKHELATKETKIDQLQKHILWLETEQLVSKTKTKISNDSIEKKMSNSKNDDEINRLRKENEKLKRQLQDKPTVEADTATCGIQQGTGLTQLIEDKFKGGFDDIKINVEKLIDEKLNGLQCQLRSFQSPSHTYADAARTISPSMNLANHLQSNQLEERNETLAEEMDQRSRVKNLIIHGNEETDAATDALFTKYLFKDLEIRPLSIDYIERTGRKLRF